MEKINIINNCLVFRGILIILAMILILPLANASVGLGISPSKINLEMESGKTQEMELLVFNTGDKTLDISLNVEGDISEFTTVEPLVLTVEPEPVPQELPIKNGKKFKITFKPTASLSDKKYTGKITAVGNAGAGSQFGGNVGVATQVQLNVVSTKLFSAFFTKTNLIIGAIIVSVIIVLILLILFIKKSGMKIKFEKKKK
jgi:hypothetical protein